MFQDNLLLLVILGLGLLFNNNLVAAGAGSLIVLKIIQLHSVLRILEHRAIDLGLLFLLVGVLVPFALDRVGMPEIINTFRSIKGIIAIGGGILAAYLCGKGLYLMQIQPQVVVGLVIGTVIGVSLLRGIPVGPLAAAGITAVLFKLLGLDGKN